MAFDAGELVATLRMGALQAFVNDANTAKRTFVGIGSSADLAGSKSEGFGKRAQTGASLAAKGYQQAASSIETAAQKAVAAEGKAADARAKAGAAAARTAALVSQYGDLEAQAAKKPLAPLEQIQQARRQEAEAARIAGAAEVEASRAAEAALEKQRGQLKELGVGMTAFGVAAGAAFAIAVKQSADFSSSQAQLRALAKGDTDSAVQLASQMSQAGDAALTAGQQYGQTAQDVSKAEIELQKAGVGITEQLGGALPGALTLAAAGQVDVAEATSTAATAMTQFDLSARDIPHLADLLAAGSDKALGGVDDLSMGLKQGGLVASQMGLSIDDTVGTMSAFAQAGLIGSDAGTSFKTMLLALQSPSQQAQAYLDKYNITAYDSQGAFVGITNLAGQLQTKLGNLSQAQRDAALSTIFGSDAIRSANVLYNNGAGGIQDWIDKVNDSGFASRQAADKMDSLSGDATKLSSAFQNGLIKAGVELEPVLRLVAQGATAVLSAFDGAPPIVGGVALALVGIVAAAALSGGALLLLLPKIAAVRVAARDLAAADIPLLSAGLRKGTAAMGGFRGAASSAASVLGGPWGIALAAAGAALALYNKAVTDAQASTATLEAAGAQGAAGIDKLTQAAAQGQNEAQGWAGIISSSFDFTAESRTMDDLAVKLEHLSQSPLPAWLRTIGGQGDLAALQNTLGTLGTTLANVSQTNAPAAAQAFEALGKKYHLTAQAQGELLNQMSPYRDALEASATSAGLLTGKETDQEKTKKLLAYASKEAAGSLQEESDAGADAASQMSEIAGSGDAATTSVKDLANALKGLGSTQLDANAAQRDFEQAVDDAEKAVGKAAGGLNKLHTGFDLTSEAGRAGSEALDGIASSAANNAAALESNGASQKDITAAVKEGRTAYIAAAKAMGIGKEAAEKLADGVHLIPGDVKLIFRADNAAIVQEKIDAIKATMNNLDGQTADVYINARLAGVDPGQAAQIAKNSALGRAGGGDLDAAPGPKGVDSMIFRGAKGEHVLTAEDVDAMGGQGKVYAFRRGLHNGVSGYATGGAIGDAESKRRSAQTQADALEKQIAKQVAAVKKSRREAAAAEKAYQKASDASSAVYGKGTGDAKHAAAQKARALSAASKKAAKDEKAAEDKLSKLRDDLQKKQDTISSQSDRRTTLGQDREDLAFDVTQGNLIDPSNTYGAFQQAVSASRNGNYTAAQRKALDQVAHTQGDVLAGLQKRQADATTDFARQTDVATRELADQAKKTQAAIDADNEALSGTQEKASAAASALQQVQSAMDGLRDQVASTVVGFFDLGSVLKETESKTTSLTHNAGTLAAWDEKVTTVTAGGTTVGDIRAQSLTAAQTENGFADQLEQLVRKGYSTLVVQDVARLGVDKGSQIASALLNGTGDDVAAINGNYSSSAAAGQRAGGTVSTQAYGDQLSAATAAANAANAAVDVAKAQLAQDKALSDAQVAAGEARLQKIKDAEQANTDAINRQITDAQQKIVTALQTALSGTTKKANGGIVERFALGGIRPQAHIAPAGSNRILYGEPETGGEAYIPFAPSKRTRSLAILGESARRLGVAVSGTRAMADGGILGAGSGGEGDVFDFRGAQFVNTSKQDMLDALREYQNDRKGTVMSTTLRRPRGA